jgi:predicted CoA-binding protein
MDDITKKKIAVVGVSHKEERVSFRIFRDLVNAGFNVNGINPADGEMAGRKIYRNLKELESIPDLVITVVPPKVTERIVEECRELGIKEVWMQPGSESKTAVNKARDYGISVVYNDCFMVKNHIW